MDRPSKRGGLDGLLAPVFHPIAVGGQRCPATDLFRGGRCSYPFFFSATSGGMPQHCELIWTSVEGAQVLAGGLKSPCEKHSSSLLRDGILRGDHSSPSSLIALSWCGWAPHPLWVWRYVKRMTVRGWGQSQSPITLPCPKSPEKKGCHLFSRHSHRTRSCGSQQRDADHFEWRGRVNTLSLCSDGKARGQ